MSYSRFFVMGMKLAKIEFWGKQYELSFQFWGDGNNNVYIEKDGVELTSFGGFDTAELAMDEAIEWCEKSNPSKKYPKGIEITNPQP